MPDLMMYIWAGVLIVSVIAEAVTAALIAIWFMPAAIVSLILAALGVNTAIQIVVFFAISIVCLVLFPARLQKAIQQMRLKNKTNLDAILGAEGTVEEDISPDEQGRVKIMGQSWSAVSQCDRTILKGERVKILAIEGVKLICEPADRIPIPDDSLVGLVARVETTIDNYTAKGRILINGHSFLAKSSESDVIPQDTIVEIIAIDQGKCICARKVPAMTEK